MIQTKKSYPLRIVVFFVIVVASSFAMPISSKVFIAGATGATGKHVVQQLLEKGNSVVAVTRSKDTMMGLIPQKDYGDRLQIHEASILDLSDDELKSLTKGCSAVVSCLGHRPTFDGLFGHPKRLVTDATKRLTAAMPSDSKFILMGTEAVQLPIDPKRTFLERSVLFLLRNLLPPHVDNEEVAAFLQEHKEINWSALRPTNLVDADEADGIYKIQEESSLPLFGSQAISRANVAHFMVELVTNESTYSQWKHKMPVIVEKESETKAEL
ncbi:unnamed protein product [Cylindrotheca closterium]|uniref:NAD(P)-binding domain-containing protein n=1 Tax=Cylindrotheca closterium TaxID=2856 RepID=A0AAD2CUJ6_9STRA|nr:unnamed protein product [Cylindrotheca closterium]